jgi:hypothetical protein
VQAVEGRVGHDAFTTRMLCDGSARSYSAANAVSKAARYGYRLQVLKHVLQRASL